MSRLLLPAQGEATAGFKLLQLCFKFSPELRDKAGALGGLRVSAVRRQQSMRLSLPTRSEGIMSLQQWLSDAEFRVVIFLFISSSSEIG